LVGWICWLVGWLVGFVSLFVCLVCLGGSSRIICKPEQVLG
jgi:hypothetical protein